MVGVFEIELKALLSKEKYDELIILLPKMMSLFNEESLNTAKFRTNNVDIRLRWSEKTNELVCKDGKAIDISRKEITIPLSSESDIKNLIEIFHILDLDQDPSWITHKKEYAYEYNGYTYTASLQYTENFAYILEVEYTCEDNNQILHELNIREIFSELGLEAIDNDHFSDMITQYIKENKNG